MKYLIVLLFLVSCAEKPKVKDTVTSAMSEQFHQDYDSLVAAMKLRGYVPKDSGSDTFIPDSSMPTSGAKFNNADSSVFYNFDPSHHWIRKVTKALGTTEENTGVAGRLLTVEPSKFRLYFYTDTTQAHTFGYVIDIEQNVIVYDRNGNSFRLDSVGNLVQNGKSICPCDTVQRRSKDSIINPGDSSNKLSNYD